MTGRGGIATGTAGSWADTYNRDYPSVPYTYLDFNPVCDITDWNDPWQLRQCMLANLNDLNQVKLSPKLVLIIKLHQTYFRETNTFEIDWSIFSTP